MTRGELGRRRARARRGVREPRAQPSTRRALHATTKASTATTRPTAEPAQGVPALAARVLARDLGIRQRASIRSSRPGARTRASTTPRRRARACGDRATASSTFAGAQGGYGNVGRASATAAVSPRCMRTCRASRRACARARASRQGDTDRLRRQHRLATGPHLHYEFTSPACTRIRCASRCPGRRPVPAQPARAVPGASRARQLRARKLDRAESHGLRAARCRVTASGALYVGLMSGTSLDGVDAVLVDFAAGAPRIARVAHPCLSDELARRDLLALQQPGERHARRAGACLGNELAELLCASGRPTCCAAAAIDAQIDRARSAATARRSGIARSGLHAPAQQSGARSPS